MDQGAEGERREQGGDRRKAGGGRRKELQHVQTFELKTKMVLSRPGHGFMARKGEARQRRREAPPRPKAARSAAPPDRPTDVAPPL